MSHQLFFKIPMLCIRKDAGTPRISSEYWISLKLARSNQPHFFLSNGSGLMTTELHQLFFLRCHNVRPIAESGCIDGLFSSASEDSLMTTGTIQLATLLSGRSESLKLLGFLVWYSSIPVQQYSSTHSGWRDLFSSCSLKHSGMLHISSWCKEK